MCAARVAGALVSARLAATALPSRSRRSRGCAHTLISACGCGSSRLIPPSQPPDALDCRSPVLSKQFHGRLYHRAIGHTRSTSSRQVPHEPGSPTPSAHSSLHAYHSIFACVLELLPLQQPVVVWATGGRSFVFGRLVQQHASAHAVHMLLGHFSWARLLLPGSCVLHQVTQRCSSQTSILG